jgi:hypothetical protein
MVRLDHKRNLSLLEHSFIIITLNLQYLLCQLLYSYTRYYIYYFYYVLFYIISITLLVS